MALHAANPGHGHTIWCIDRGTVQDLKEFGVFLGFHYSMHAGHADIPRMSIGDPSIGKIYTASHVDRRHLHSEHVSMFVTGDGIRGQWTFTATTIQLS